MTTAIALTICTIGMLIGYGLFRMLLGLTIFATVIACWALVYYALNENPAEVQTYTREQLLMGAGILGLVSGFVLAPMRAVQQSLDAAKKE